MVNDSYSYMFVMDHDNKTDQCIAEFYYNSDLMVNDWAKKFELLKFHIQKAGGGHQCC